MIDRLYHIALRRLPAPGRVSVRLLDRIFDAVYGVAQKVPHTELTADQKKSISGYLFFEGPLLVHDLATGLRRHRDAFPDIPDVQELEDGLARTWRWERLEQVFLMLARRAGDQAALERADMVSSALAILDHLEGDERRHFGPPPNPARARALFAARWTLAAWKRRVGRKGR